MALCRALAETGRRRPPVPRETDDVVSSAEPLDSACLGSTAVAFASASETAAPAAVVAPFPFFFEDLGAVDAFPLREAAVPDFEDAPVAAPILERAPLGDDDLDSSGWGAPVPERAASDLTRPGRSVRESLLSVASDAFTAAVSAATVDSDCAAALPACGASAPPASFLWTLDSEDGFSTGALGIRAPRPLPSPLLRSAMDNTPLLDDPDSLRSIDRDSRVSRGTARSSGPNCDRSGLAGRTPVAKAWSSRPFHVKHRAPIDAIHSRSGLHLTVWCSFHVEHRSVTRPSTRTSRIESRNFAATVTTLKTRAYQPTSRPDSALGGHSHSVPRETSRHAHAHCAVGTRRTSRILHSVQVHGVCASPLNHLCVLQPVSVSGAWIAWITRMSPRTAHRPVYALWPSRTSELTTARRCWLSEPWPSALGLRSGHRSSHLVSCYGLMRPGLSPDNARTVGCLSSHGIVATQGQHLSHDQWCPRLAASPACTVTRLRGPAAHCGDSRRRDALRSTRQSRHGEQTDTRDSAFHVKHGLAH